jgi:predicted RNase H-like HicB family nuclease
MPAARKPIRRTLQLRRRRGSKVIPVSQYTVILSPEPEGGFTVTVPALPGCVTHGDDLVSAKQNAREAIECHLASMLKHGEPIPVDETVSTSVLVGQG